MDDYLSKPIQVESQALCRVNQIEQGGSKPSCSRNGDSGPLWEMGRRRKGSMGGGENERISSDPKALQALTAGSSG